ncbi:MAG: IclR family transcriptional regulator [Blautia sp.]
MEEKNPIQVSDRLFLVLETLAEEGPTALMDLSRMLNLHKSTVHRLLLSLSYLGYVSQDGETGKYQLTFKLCELSNKILSRLDILDVIRPYLKKLAAATGETVHFVQLDGTEAVYIYKEESLQNSVRMVSKVGSRIPLYCSGVGKAMAADMSKEQLHTLWEQSPVHALTEHTITSYEDFMQTIQEVRKNGFALDDEENEIGVRCVAVSLPDYRGRAKYAFSISAPVSRMTDARTKELAQMLLEIKKDIVMQQGL